MKSRTSPARIALLIVCGGLLALLSIVAPLLYLWIVGLTGCVVILGTTLVVIGSMNPWCLFFFGGEVIKGGLYAIGAILYGLVKSSE